MGYRQPNNPYACSPCDTRADACGCCDMGFETGLLELMITGCDGTTSLVQVTVTRYRSAAGLPCGPTSRYPATASCGVFWGTFSIGDGCDVGSGNWSGGAGVLLWCSDPGAAIPYTEEIYCYDTDLACYVYQGNATITKYECRCNGPYTEVTLPDLDCCCPAPAACCDCEDLPLTADITDGLGNTLSMALSDCGLFPSGEYVASPGTFCGMGLYNATVQCAGGVWTLADTFGTTTLSAAGTCPVLILTGTSGGCSVTVTIA